MRIEITSAPSLSQRETNLVIAHSFLNVVNILISELTMIGVALDCEHYLAVYIDDLYDLSDKLGNISECLEELEKASMLEAQIVERLNIITLNSDDEPFQKALRSRISNITMLFGFLKARGTEIVRSIVAPLSWERTPVSALYMRLTSFIRALEENSQGRFYVSLGSTAPDKNTYTFDINIESDSYPYLTIPSAFNQIAVDLIANSRKYSSPGSVVSFYLSSGPSNFSLRVADQGVGIPEDELFSVVNFGYRASNSRSKATYGAGCGLTKAALYTKRHNGRLWIDSEVNKGTTIEISIPVPLLL